MRIKIEELSDGSVADWTGLVGRSSAMVRFDIPFRRGGGEGGDYARVSFLAEGLASCARGTKRLLGDDLDDFAGVAIELGDLDASQAAEFLAKYAVGVVGRTNRADVDVDRAEEELDLDVESFTERAFSGELLEFPQLLDVWLQDLVQSEMDAASDEALARIHREHPERAVGFFASLVSHRAGFDVFKGFDESVEDVYVLAAGGDPAAVLAFTPFGNAPLNPAVLEIVGKRLVVRCRISKWSFSKSLLLRAVRLLKLLRPGASVELVTGAIDPDGKVLFTATAAGSVLTFPRGESRRDLTLLM